MSAARVFVHPRCADGPAAGALAAGLEAAGLSTDGDRVGNVVLGPPTPRGHNELVRIVETNEELIRMERLDGYQLVWRRPKNEAA